MFGFVKDVHTQQPLVNSDSDPRSLATAPVVVFALAFPAVALNSQAVP
jgi:hypothetical protein